MYGSISVDFAAMEEQKARFSQIAEDIEDVTLQLERQFEKLSNSGMNKVDELFRMNISALRYLKEELDAHKDDLEKIISIYEETEAEQLRRVEMLDIRLDGVFKGSSKVSVSGYISDALPSSAVFGGRSLKNDDWLADLVNEWRDDKNEQI